MLCFAFNCFLSFFSKFASPFFLDLCIVFVAIAGCPCLPQYFFLLCACLFVFFCLFSIYNSNSKFVKGTSKMGFNHIWAGEGGGDGGEIKN